MLQLRNKNNGKIITESCKVFFVLSVLPYFRQLLASLRINVAVFHEKLPSLFGVPYT